MSIKIILNGARGKMGQAVLETISQESDLQLVGQTTRGDDLANAINIHQANVVIDFTTPDCVFQNAKIIIESNASPVIGTTGLTVDQIQILAKLCENKKKGAIIAPNFSIGAVLMMKFSKETAKYFKDAEIIELHHPRKMDAPSGTAKKTAELIAQTKTSENASAEVDKLLSDNCARGVMYHNIPIHSLRLSNVFAEQHVIFSNPGELFTLQHKATDRNAMMPGVYFSCRKVLQLQRLIYGLNELF